MEMFYAIIFGLLFGAVLNRIGATNPNYIINMLRLTNTHLAKTIFIAIGTASLVLFIGLLAGFIDSGNLSVKTAYIGVFVGGLIFGLGFAISGLCPGTGLAAAATGRKDAWMFVLGGLLGAFVYMLIFESIMDGFLMQKIAGGAVTLAQTGNDSYAALLSDMPSLVVAGVIAVLLVLAGYFLPRKLR